MSPQDTNPPSPARRRRFAAKYHYRGKGVGFAIAAAFFLIGGIVQLVSPDPENDMPSGIPFTLALGLAAVAIYFLRGQGVDPRPAQRREALAQQRAAQAEAEFSSAKEALRTAVGGGAALVAYRNLNAVAKRWYPADADERVRAASHEIGFDFARITSDPLGMLQPLSKGPALEFFADWVVLGGEAHDVEASTRGQVYVDGSIQIISRSDKKGRPYTEKRDLRTAEVQINSANWSMRVPIKPDDANEARRLVDLLAIHAEKHRPRAVSHEDIRAMVDSILANTGQPPAEKLTQLSNLRYNRLLTDEEFERAKAKILGF